MLNFQTALSFPGGFRFELELAPTAIFLAVSRGRRAWGIYADPDEGFVVDPVSWLPAWVCRWLARRGHPGPLEERERRLRSKRGGSSFA